MSKLDDIQKSIGDLKPDEQQALQQWLLREGKPEAENLHSWSQHYDTMQATVAALCLGSSGIIYGKIMDSFSLHLALAGALLTLCSLFATTSFRSLQKRIHSCLPPKEHALLRSKLIVKQWYVNWMVHFVFFSFWGYQFFVRHSERFSGWATAFLISAFCLVLGYLFYHELRNPESSTPVRYAGRVVVTSNKTIIVETSKLSRVSATAFATPHDAIVLAKGPVRIEHNN